MQAVLIIFDRLPYGLLGCYGNTEVTTSGFDRLAASGVTFDLCFNTNPVPDETLCGLPEAVTRLGAAGTAVHIISQEGSSVAAQLTSVKDVEGVCTSLIPENTQPLADQVIAALSSSSNSAAPEKRGLTIVSLMGRSFSCPSYQLPRLRAEVAEADEVIARLIDRFSPEVKKSDEYLLLVTAALGCQPTGDDEGASTRRLLDPLVHVPLLGRLDPSVESGVRCQALVTWSDVLATLLNWFECEAIPRSDSQNLLPLMRGKALHQREAVIVRGPDGEYGIRTPHWYLTARLGSEGLYEQRSAAIESATLFRKPEDFWDVLDVSRQIPDVTEQLVDQLLATLTKGAGEFSPTESRKLGQESSGRSRRRSEETGGGR